MEIIIIETKTVPTIKVVQNGKTIYLHSKYNPMNEVYSWVENFVKIMKTNENILIIGLGAGYHIKQIALACKNQKVNVIEFNDEFYSWFIKSIFYESLSTLENVCLLSFSRLSVNEKERLFSSYSSTNIKIHKSGMDLIPEKYVPLQSLLKDLQYQQLTIDHQIDSLIENFDKNTLLNDVGIGKLRDDYRGRPMILASAGPSLTKQLPLLKEIKEEGLITIGAVGTAIKPMLKSEIIPDFFMISDPNKATLSQLVDVNIPEAKLFYLSTAFYETVLLHQGERYILYQHGFGEAENRAKKRNEPLIKTGGSVATSLLDTMIWLGAKSVALVGQDLAYTHGQSHAKGAHLQKIVNVTSNQLQVDNYDKNGLVNTSKNLTIYRKWLELYAQEHSDLSLYNCTEGGAYIENWNHIPLFKYKEIIK
ncbi:motility associated factor glycosyltransferase family protein [Sporosarcina gallistercoris]|uniref:Motility associated factor glycosyltransferase family protein n=1 Tax=Sporosarcina gallistercoris TaxID=2762245 RepID=A0ABR8PN72_9BACL|nr:6-hydroxymethylpterin diphosphokinase MptE-like protein [Sporosarcina gallistercoris]MBD7909608.1 motility associated factor glycosyltransferase family protein [Sporosarcina gallistercoris]